MPGADRFSRYHNIFTDNKWMFIEKNWVVQIHPGFEKSYIQGSYIRVVKSYIQGCKILHPEVVNPYVLGLQILMSI